MLLIGLTGSIATGKSTVSSLLRSEPYSLPIIDADVLARSVVEPGTPGYNAIVAHFLPSTPDLLLPATDPACEGREDGADGKGRPLNRAVLGRRVFGDSEERRRDRSVLNGIVHPAVRLEIFKAIAYYYIRGQWAVVLDVPLLFEAGMDSLCGVVVVVGVSDPKIQMKRLRERDAHLSGEDAENRVRSQGDVKGKVERVRARGEGWGTVVWNDGGKEDLKREVEAVMAKIRSGSPRWWGYWLVACPPMGAGAAAWTWVRNWRERREWEATKRKEKARL